MTTQNSNGTLITTIQNKVATLEFGHPASNSLPSQLLDKLVTELISLDNNPLVSVIILKSSGTKVFCAGASFDELIAVKNLDDATKFFSGFAKVINTMKNSSKIIIGHIHGKAVGGGVGIIAACDYAMATTESSIKLSELAIGIGPFVIEPAVTRKIGKSAMVEMTLETEWKSASWANQKGLYAKVLETTTELNNEIMAFANKLASYNLETLSEIKKMFWEGTENWNTLLYKRAKISGKLLLSDFSKKALTQFKK